MHSGDIFMGTQRSFMLVLLLVAAVMRSSAQQKDSIFLYNGQVLIGEVLHAALGLIEIDDTDLGDIRVKMYKIKRLITNRRFRIETDDKRVYFGTLQSSGKDGSVDILPDGMSTVTTDITGISLIIPLEKGIFKGIDGNISAGFSYTKSSNIGQVNVSATLFNSARRFEYRLTASENASIDSSEFSRDREDLRLVAGYNFSDSWIIMAGGSYQRNLELSIARRYQELAGIGNKLIVRKNTQLMVLTGITFNQEKSTEGEASGLLLEVPLISRFDFFKYKDPNMQIAFTPAAYISLSQKGRVRFEGNLTFAWQIITDFNFNVNPYMNFDNQPPSGGGDFDYGIVISLSYKF